MSAVPAGVLSISTIYDGSGNLAAQIEIDCSPTNYPTYQSTDALTGAKVVNNTGGPLSVVIWDTTTDPPTPSKPISVPAGSSSLTAQQLRRAGYSTVGDCAGVSFAAV
jgi:hypothetical protein